VIVAEAPGRRTAPAIADGRPWRRRWDKFRRSTRRRRSDLPVRAHVDEQRSRTHRASLLHMHDLEVAPQPPITTINCIGWVWNILVGDGAAPDSFTTRSETTGGSDGPRGARCGRPSPRSPDVVDAAETSDHSSRSPAHGTVRAVKLAARASVRHQRVEAAGRSRAVSRILPTQVGPRARHSCPGDFIRLGHEALTMRSAARARHARAALMWSQTSLPESAPSTFPRFSRVRPITTVTR